MSDSETHLAASHSIVLLRQRRGLNIIICVGEYLLVGAPLRIVWIRGQPVAPRFALGLDANLDTLLPLDVHQSSGFALPGVSFRNALVGPTQIAPRVEPVELELFALLDVVAKDSIRRDDLGLVRALVNDCGLEAVALDHRRPAARALLNKDLALVEYDLLEIPRGTGRHPITERPPVGDSVPGLLVETVPALQTIAAGRALLHEGRPQLTIQRRVVVPGPIKFSNNHCALDFKTLFDTASHSGQ